MYRLLLFVSAFALSTQLHAQKMFVGPEIGMNLIQVQEQEIGNDFQPGWYGGLAFDYKFNDWLSLRTGAYFSQGKHSYSSADTSQLDLLGGILDSSFAIPGFDMNTYSSTYGRNTQHYIQVPVQANFAWKGLNVFLGGYVGFMVGAKQKETTIERTPFMETIDISELDPTGGLLAAFLPSPYEESYSESSETEDLRMFDYGFKGGVGYQYEQFGFQAAYSFGLPDYRLESESEDVLRNQYFQFSIRYMFPLGSTSGISSIR